MCKIQLQLKIQYILTIGAINYSSNIRRLLNQNKETHIDYKYSHFRYKFLDFQRISSPIVQPLVFRDRKIERIRAEKWHNEIVAHVARTVRSGKHWMTTTWDRPCARSRGPPLFPFERRLVLLAVGRAIIESASFFLRNSLIVARCLPGITHDSIIPRARSNNFSPFQISLISLAPK